MIIASACLLAGCAGANSPDANVMADQAEFHASVAAMRNHPSLSSAVDSGPPINVPTAVPRKPAMSHGHDDHHPQHQRP